MLHPGHLLRRALQAMNLLWMHDVSNTITSPQFAALNALYREPDIDQRTLGERISLDRSTMAEVVARLSAKGLIKATRDVRDGRRKAIQLTPKGLAVLQRLIPRTRAMTSRLVGALEKQEQADLLRLLTAVVDANERRKPHGKSPRAIRT
jgi:MarR family transcriptional regulator, temperature-dependent positive regulator of motility